MAYESAVAKCDGRICGIAEFLFLIEGKPDFSELGLDWGTVMGS